MSKNADRVFSNAKVYSVEMDGSETRAEAVAVKDGRFVYVGTDDGVREWIGRDTVVTDCKGGSILPGFGDAHMHFAWSIKRFGVVDLYDLVTDPSKITPGEVISIIQQRVKKFADEHPDYPVINGMGWNRFWFMGELQGIERPFTRHDLDAVVSDRPVILDSYCGHVCMFNTKALEMAGITKDTPDPSAGIIRREADGTPDGFVQEPVVIGPIVKKIEGSEFTEERQRTAMLDAQKLFASRGYTYVSDCMASDKEYEIVKKLAENGELTLRIDGVYNCNDATRDDDFRKACEKNGHYDVGDIFKVDTVKYFVDGNLAMLEPYDATYCKKNGLQETTGTADALLWDVKHLKESMEKVQKAGFNIHVHAMGDLGARVSIDCIENAKKQDSSGKLRDIIAHCSFVSDEDKRRMGKLGIIASIQPEWQSESLDTNPGGLTDMLGAKRHRTIYPNRSLLDAGIVCAYGSDFPVALPHAISGLQIAQTRRLTSTFAKYEIAKDVPAMNPAESVSLKDAVKAHTICVAYQFHRENLTGSIKVGKSAEMVVLDKDIEKQPADRLMDLNIVETLFKGKTTYRR